jgi:hypothetical protein
MNEAEVVRELQKHFKTRLSHRHAPTAAEWRQFESRVSWSASETFRSLMLVAPRFCFEGGLLSVAAEDGIEGEDTILSCIAAEESIGGWNTDWLPFYDFGNGDYYVLSKSCGKVFCVRHEDRATANICSSLEEWIRGLPSY